MKEKQKFHHQKWMIAGTSLVVQWLRLGLPMQGVGVQSLVRELRSHVPHGQKIKTQNRSNTVANSIKTLKIFHIKNKNLKKKNCKLETEIPFQMIFNLKKLQMLSLARMHPQSLSHVLLFLNPWTVTLQALYMEFSRQEYQKGLPFATPGDLPDPEIKPVSLVPPH